jgi:hypothetical protein
VCCGYGGSGFIGRRLASHDTILNCWLMRWIELSLQQQLVSKFTMVKLLGSRWIARVVFDSGAAGAERLRSRF